MKKSNPDPAVANKGSLQSKKTNQDFNQKKPDLSDPNEEEVISPEKSRKIIKDRKPSGHGK
jgi:hypothetical protein